MKTLFLASTYMLWILACGSGASGSGDQQTTDAQAPRTSMEQSLGKESADGSSASVNSGSTIEMTEKKIIRNGSLSFKVKDAKKTREEMNAIIGKNKGYIGNEHLDNSDYQTQYTLQIRVPADNLDALVADIEALDGTVTYKSIQARDVTEEFIDLETRLKNKKAYLDQFRTLLKSAKTIEDILQVQTQIRQLEEEIESVTGRLKYLSNQVDLSTLDLTLTETKDFVYRPDRRINFIERFKESVSSGWYGFVNFCLYMFTLWPFWIILFGLVWGWRKYQRNKKGKLPPVPQ